MFKGEDIQRRYSKSIFIITLIACLFITLVMPISYLFNSHFCIAGWVFLGTSLITVFLVYTLIRSHRKELAKVKLNEKFMDMLIKIACTVKSEIDVETMWGQIIKILGDFFETPVVFTCFPSEGSQEMHINSQIGLKESFTGHSCKYKASLVELPDNNKGCYCISAYRSVNIQRLSEHIIFDHVDSKEKLAAESIVSIPLESDNQLYGVLHIAIPSSKNNFLFNETGALGMLADEIASGIKRRNLEEEIKLYARNLENMVEERTAQLRVRDAQLIQSSKLATLGEMAAGIAHEINQPLGGIALITQGLIMAQNSQKLTGDMLLKKLNEITGQIERISKIANHLRAFARQSKEAKQKVNINMPLVDVFDFIANGLKARNIEVDLETCKDISLIMAEHNKLEQIFINIILNAADALDEFEVTVNDLKKMMDVPEWVGSWSKKITIRTYENDKKVFVSLADNAGGIPEEIIEKIFDPFFTTKTFGKGTGIGLSITYGIIKEFNGTIKVETEKMKGSRFVLGFPAVR